MMQFGMMASAMGVMALGYALYQAWKQTDGEGMVLDLTGPFVSGKGRFPRASGVLAGDCRSPLLKVRVAAHR